MTFTFVAHNLDKKEKRKIKTLKHFLRVDSNDSLLLKLINKRYEEILRNL